MFLHGESSAAPTRATAVESATQQVLGLVAKGDATTAISCPAPISADVCDFRADYNKDPVELLPAWRWRSALNISVRGGGGGMDFGAAASQMSTMVASIGFAVASVLWTITLMLVKLSTTSDYLTLVGNRVNQGFASLSGGLMLIIGILWFFVLFRAGKHALKGDPVSALRGVVTFVLPIAFLVTFHANAAESTKSLNNTELATEQSEKLSVYTPVGLAQRVTTTMGTAAEGFGSGFELFGGASKNVLNFDQGDPGLSCDDYIAGLYDQYNKFNKKVGGVSGSSALEQVSKFWVVTAYVPWMDAQFGDSSLRNTVACQQLEEGTSFEERKALMLEASGFPQSPPMRSTLESDSDAKTAVEKNEGHSATGIYTAMTWDRRFAFAACKWSADAGWKVDWRWVAVGKPSIGEMDGMSNEEMQTAYNSKTNTASDWCKTWWEKGYSEGKGDAAVSPTLASGKKMDVGMGEMDPGGSTTDGTSAHDVNSREANRFVNDYYGRGGMTRMSLGILAAVTAGVYLFVLGGVAFGGMLAQFGLILLLIFLPVTLVGLAAGAGFGSKMLKLTIMMCGSKVIFTLLLAVMVQLTMLGIVLFNSMGAGVGASGRYTGASLAGSVSSAIVPLLVLFMINKGLSSAGLGKLTSLTGAVGAIGKMAQKATGDSSVGDFVGNKAKGGGKITNAAKGLASKGMGSAKKTAGAASSKVPGVKNLRHMELKRNAKAASRAVENLQRTDPAGYAALQKKKAGGTLTAEEAKAADGYSSKLSGLERGASRSAATLASAQAADELRLAKLGIGRNAKSAASELQAASTSLDHEELMRKAELEDASRNAFGADYMAENHTMPELSGDPASAQDAETSQNRAVLRLPAAQQVEAAAGLLDTRRLECAVASGNTHGEALTRMQREAVKTKAAASLGLEAANMVSDEFGNTFVHKASLTPEQLRSLNLRRPELLLDEEVTAIRVGSGGMQETEEDYATRVGLTLLAAGSMYVDSSGAQPTVVMVDQMAAAGLGSQQDRQVAMSAMLGEIDGPRGHAILGALPTVTVAQTPVGRVHLKALEVLSDRGRQRYEGIREEAVVSVERLAEDWADGLRSQTVDLGDILRTVKVAVGQIDAGGSQAVFGRDTFDNLLPQIVSNLAGVSTTIGCLPAMESILNKAARNDFEDTTDFLALPGQLESRERAVTDSVAGGQTPQEVLSVLKEYYAAAGSNLAEFQILMGSVNTHKQALNRLLGGSAAGTDSNKSLPSSKSLRNRAS